MVGAVAHRALGTPRLKGLKERQVLHEVLTGPAPTAVGARAGDPAWTSRLS